MQSTLTTENPAPPADGDAAERVPRPAWRGDAAPTVLVAEDDVEVREMLTTLLRARGYAVVETGDGQEAVEVARAVRPDIVLIDLQLPRLNGFAVARFLRQTDALRRVPIIVVSAHDPAKHRNLALAAGCNAYVQKPVDFDRLDELMTSLLPQS